MTAATPNASVPVTYVVGHRNPDTDAICSAIAYVAFKEARGEKGFVAARCGNSNARIDTVLKRFHQPLPLYLSDVTPRVRDVMISNVISVRPTATCAEALEVIDAHDVRVLPVTTNDNRVIGSISVFQLGGYFIPRMRAPREMRKVHTSLAHIARALKGRIIHMREEDREEDLFIRIGAMDVRSFGKFSEVEGIGPEQSIIIVGDRWDIQQRSIQIGVRALVVTGNLPIDEEVIEQSPQSRCQSDREPLRLRHHCLGHSNGLDHRQHDRSQIRLRHRRSAPRGYPPQNRRLQHARLHGCR
ncbi:MAG: DRTGG domain-containing protein [Nibricoccus sp.]